MLAQRLRALRTLTETLAESGPVHEAAPRVLGAIGEPLGWELGSLWQRGVDGRALGCVATWRGEGLAEEAVADELSSDPLERLAESVVARSQPEWLADISGDSALGRLRMVAELGVHAVLVFPISTGPDSLGAVELFSREVIEPDGELLALMASVGSQIGHYIEARTAEDSAKLMLQRERDHRARAETSQQQARHLAVQLLEAEERERSRLSQALHDESVQNLLVVLQDLREARKGDPEALVRAEEVVSLTVRQLRETVFELHPVGGLEQGIVGAIRALADRNARRAGFHPKVSVAGDAIGVHDGFLFSVTRELLTNAAKHAAAGEVSVTIDRVGDSLVLEVADDGRGFDPNRLASAAKAGHIGLSLLAERIEALGGTLEILSAAGDGTRVRATVAAPSGASSGDLP